MSRIIRDLPRPPESRLSGPFADGNGPKELFPFEERRLWKKFVMEFHTAYRLE
ncbi:hypothetical protein [Sphingobacterium endophyticum]|uniref:hypothetical protein n=1 Tax=Sphingobacterium endophyticum TaxID=2546448 RepID=UPI0012E23734|nr:hypothetical protein [Sphingobacterium endophyticum]